MKTIIAKAALAVSAIQFMPISARASVLTFTGTVTARTEVQGELNPAAFNIGAPVTISFNSSDSTPPLGDFFPTFTQIRSAIDLIEVGNSYPSGAGYGPHDVRVTYGFFGAGLSFLEPQFSPIDGDYRLDATTSATLPQDTEQSFGPIQVIGSAEVRALYVDYDVNPFGYHIFDVRFALSTLSVQGSIPAVPLPASAPLLAAACAILGLGGLALRLRQLA